MKIALLSANIGSFDTPHPIVKQSEEYELFYYTENTLPFPLPNLDNRMKGKYFKTQAHRFLDHDVFIWGDGSIEVIDGHFIRACLVGLEKHDVVITEHAERSNPFQEFAYIKEHINKPYLFNRYCKQPFDAEASFYREAGMPEDTPLYNCYFFARWNSEKLNTAFDTWWDITLRYTNLDQAAFSYAAWKHRLNIKIIENKDLFIRHKHL